ncbi:MAG: ComEA family DNA-binding protein [bacterium]
MKIVLFLQKVFKVTKSELTIIALLLLGLGAGLINQAFGVSKSVDNYRFEKVNKVIDSVTKADRSTFIGTDIRGNSFEELSAGDSLVKKEELYPKKAKKEVPAGVIININTASRVQLMKLPGIGEKTAQKIIDYRAENPFRSINDIMNVKGIGPKKFEKMRASIKV